MEIFFSELAATKLETLSNYLLTKLGQKVKKEFLAKLISKIKQIETYPESCPKSDEFNGIYKCVVSEHNTFYYRINFQKKEIEIITFFDSRQKPKKLKKEIK